MKYFSKLLSMLLVGAMLVSTACTDYAEDIKNTNERVDKVEAEVKDILELLDKIECEHGDALDAIIAGHCDDLAGLAEDIQDANDEILALKGVDADLKKSIEFINSLLKELAGTEDESKLLSAMATWNALLDGLKVFYETQLEGLLSDVESAKAFMAAMNETLSAYKATYSQKVGMGAVVEDLETVIAKFQALEKEFAQYKEDTALEFSKVYAAIASLGSVQSIVYVPEYSDGCATIDYALINNMIVEARSTMEFMVTPASGAGKIVSMFEANPESLAIVHEDLKERLNTRSAEHLFNIAKVYTKAGEADRLFVEFDARHLTPEFYNGEQSLALSLVYNAGNEGDVTSEANVASCFVKTIATTKPEVLKYDIVATVEGKKTFVTNTVAEIIPIQFNNLLADGTEAPAILLDMHKVAFYAEGFEAEYRTFEQMIEQGYDLNIVQDIKPTDAAGYRMNFADCDADVPQTKNPLKASFAYTEGAHDYYQSEIVEECQIAKYVGFVGTYKYNYIVESNYYKYDPAITLNPETNDLTPDEFYAESAVKITPIIVEVELDAVPFVWDYVKDAAEDAKGEKVARYSRTYEVKELPTKLNEALKAASALKQINEEVIMKAYELIGDKDARPTFVKFAIIDEVDDNNTDLSDAYARVYHEFPYNCQHDAGDCAYKLDIQNLQWENWGENVQDGDVLRDYAVTMSYVDNKYVHLVFKVKVNTVDRCRKPVAVDYDTFSELVYHSNMKFTFDGNTDLLDNLWDARTAGDQAKHYASVTKAEWLKDNFVTNELKSDSDKDSKYASMLVFDIVADKKYEFNVVYDYADETGIVNPTKLYKKDIKTWYGQDFTLNKTIEFQSPDYAFVGAEDYFITTRNNNEKWVKAHPYYYPNPDEGKMSQFAIERVNMFGAFDLEKSHGSVIVLPSDHTQHDLYCPVSVNDYTAEYADADIVNTQADKKTNKEKDANYRTYDAGVLTMPEADNELHNLYQDLAGNWHYTYTDVLRPMFRADNIGDKEHIKFNTVATTFAKNDDLTDYSYALAYYGYDKSVAVDADLYIMNDNNTQFAVNTNFANGVEEIYGVKRINYSDFNVEQYYPFANEFSVRLDENQKPMELNRELGAAVHQYKVTVAQAFTMKDKRGYELINNEIDNEGEYPFFRVGDDKNGFAMGKSAADVYGFPFLYEYCNHVNFGVDQPKTPLGLKFEYKYNFPEQYKAYFDRSLESKGIVVFNYDPELKLEKPLEVEVTVTFLSSWTCDGKTKASTIVRFGHDLE